jgi:hypothetical protein
MKFGSVVASAGTAVRMAPDLSAFPLCDYFLSAYLSSTDDPDNFPPDEIPAVFQRYEDIFASALSVLGLTKEALKSRSEFNFDSGDRANLEGGIAILRTVEALRIKNFSNITLVKPPKNLQGADISANKNGEKVCFEVKAITKQSSGRKGLFFADQLYEKILESVSNARNQLQASASELGCTLKILVCVVNWFSQSIYLGQDDYQAIVNRLERDQDQESLKGIDGVWFVTRFGQEFVFLNDRAKSIDS